MKRSEMVKLIAQAFEYCRFVDAINMDYWHANQLLHDIEAAGMLPPVIFYKPEDEPNGPGYEVPMWERENE